MVAVVVVCSVVMAIVDLQILVEKGFIDKPVCSQ